MDVDAWAKMFYDWLWEQARVEGKSSHEWKAAGSPDNEHYRAGASNAFLEMIDFFERHPVPTATIEVKT